MQKIGVLALLWALALPLAAGEPRLIDLKTKGPQDSSPHFLGATPTRAYFRAKTPETGLEIWTTDGTTAGTRMIADMTPGAVDHVGDAGAYGLLGERLLYPGNSGAAEGVFITDGSTTTKIASGDAFDSRAVFIDGIAYFVFSTVPGPGYEIWRSDGTKAGTYPLDPPAGVSRDSIPFGLFGLGKHVYWMASLNPHLNPNVVGLFRSDGTLAGSSMVTTLENPGAVVYRAGGRAFFLCRTYISSRRAQLWVTDGTLEGTKMLREFPDPFSDARLHGVVGNRVLFTAHDDLSGAELWSSDGTAEGTMMLADVVPGPVSSRIISAAGDPQFLHEQYTASLWTSDGTPAGTRKVSTLGAPSIPGAMFNGMYLFSVRYDDSHYRLWRSDGTEAGALPFGPATGSWALNGNFARRPDGILFMASDGVSGAEPWFTDGTTGGTRLVANIVGESRNSSEPSSLVVYQDRLLFHAYGDDFSGIWRSDGTEAGTVPVATGDFRRPVVTNGLCFFQRDEQAALWRTDGTAAGTIRLQGMSGDHVPQALPNGVVFAYNDGSSGLEPWFSDGTVSGTRLVADLVPGSGGSLLNATFFVTSAGTLYIGTSRGLWRSDGTTAGTVNVLTPPSGFLPTPLVFGEMGGVVYFVQRLGSNVFELWRTDGTSAGTSPVATVNDRPPQALWSLGSILVFLSDDSLYASGGGAPTFLGKTERIPCEREETMAMVRDGVLYWRGFAAMWRTDGTEDGTWPVAAMPGDDQCVFPSIVAYLDRIYFRGYDPAHGFELWTSVGGDPDRTDLLHDLEPGTMRSTPGNFTLLGSRLLFAAETVENGRELWVLELSPRRRSVRH